MLTLESALGLIGGLNGLIWLLIGIFLGDYQSFKFSTALISEIYSTTAKERMMEENIPRSKQEADADLTQSLESRGRYNYPYEEFFSTWLLMNLCCCFKRRLCYKRRQKRFNRHKVA